MKTDVMVERLLAWRDSVAVREIRGGVAVFMGLPDHWFEDAHYFCANGHVSSTVLKSEARGTNCCLACREPVVLGPKVGEREFAPILRVLSIEL